ncbi:MAG: metallophosphoesterase [Candidatus Scalinduaceae bacterium]
MKIGIVADSHDNVPMIKKAVAFFNQSSVEFVIHAGDYIAPFAVKEFLKLNVKLIGVFGNNDGEKRGINNLCKEIYEGPRFFNMDGKQFLVVHSLESLDSQLEKDADVIVFGHTHESEIRKNGKIYVNPGECGGWVNGKSSVAIMDSETCEVEIIDLFAS